MLTVGTGRLARRRLPLVMAATTLLLHVNRFAAPPLCAADDDLGVQVPPGFEVSLYAGDELAHNIFSMTIDARGRLVVAGPEYVKILEDLDGDGQADVATLFSDTPKSGAHGMYFDGPDLICTGDDAVRRLPDANGDDRADSEGEVWTRLRHPEHGANGIVRGPDGCYYVVCGNDAGITAEHAELPGSPVKEPRCGGVVRFSPEGRRIDVYAHGFRNPYDVDFHRAGRLFTVDSDGERDHYLPWYAPARLFDVAQGMEHGWLLAGWQRSWNRPESFFDNVERLLELGRGSPTGLVVYRHRQFPEHYRDGVFTACWTLGRVYHVPLEPSGASFQAEHPAEIFAQTAGDVGFAPVDLAVGPGGDLFVAIGGRGTRGGVFRIRYKRPLPPRWVRTPLDQVLEAEQPLASWSRAGWVPLAENLGRQVFVDVITGPQYGVWQQVRAVEVLTELFGGLEVDEARRSLVLDRPELSARIAWSLGRTAANRASWPVLSELTYHFDERVRRDAWEAIGAVGAWDAGFEPQPNWIGAAQDSCRRSRAAMLLAARRVARQSFEAALAACEHEAAPRLALARLWVAGPGTEDDGWFATYFHTCLDVWQAADDAPTRLEAVRLLQIALGDLRVQPGQPEVYSGYTGNRTDLLDGELRKTVIGRLARQFPTGAAELDRELARLMSMLSTDDAALLEAVAGQWTSGSSPQDDLHYLIVFSRLPGARRQALTQSTARALTGLHAKMARRQMYPDRNWPLRVAELFDELCRRDPQLAAAVAADDDFGLPAHSLFAARMTGQDRELAARRLLAAVSSNEAGWTAEVVKVVADLPNDEILPVLREQWHDYAVRDWIALVLAARRQPEDRPRLVESLGSVDPQVVRQAAEALAQFEGAGEADELAAAVAALRHYCGAPQEQAARLALARLLAHWSGERISVEEPPQADSDSLRGAWQPWFHWYAETYPEQASRLAGFAGADAAAWRERLSRVPWHQGNGEKGRRTFEKLSCHRCHAGGGRLGPSLAGAAARFSRDDLFAAIVEPSSNVAPLYQTSMVVTQSGQVYHGLLVYESADGLLVQTGADTTARITGDDLAGVYPSRQSLMPTGLLNEATDQDLADLYEYLKTVDK